MADFIVDVISSIVAEVLPPRWALAFLIMIVVILFTVYFMSGADVPPAPSGS